MIAFKPRPLSLFEQARAELAAQGVKLHTRPGEYVVNVRGTPPDKAYVTDDLDAAIDIGRQLAAMIANQHVAKTVPAAEGATDQPRRRRKPRRMTPKAMRRRMIRQHNRRLSVR
jgi:hypothetical protein